jgi:hypothetical protein
MPDYAKTIIYKIQHQEDESLIYVGNTTDFTKRKHHHKDRCNSPNNAKRHYKIYKMIRDNGGWDCFKMIQIKEFPCSNRREADAEEDKIMLELKANMNDRRAYRPREQYRIDNVENKREYDMEYRKKNKEQIIQKKKDYYEKNKQQITCECGCIVVKNHIARHKKSNRHIKLLNETLKQ